MRLSPNFTLAELTLSETAARYGIDNDPPEDVIESLRRTAGMLEEIRALAGCPIIVTSGYRSDSVNRAVGGSKTSAHVFGLAADINAARLDPDALARLIAGSAIRFDQCILEFSRWVHVGLARGMAQPRREVLTAVKQNGRTVYLKGIV